MYHPGKVVKVLVPKDKDIISSDAAVQAVVSMWDENLFTFAIDSKIAGKVKDGDIILVDYTPMPNSPVPKHTIVKVLRGDTADTVWRKYKEYYSRQATIKQAMSESQDHDDYMG